MSKVAFITGAGAGVGRSTALRLVRDGHAATIVVNDIDEGRANEVAREVEALGATSIVALADVTDWDAVVAAVDKVSVDAGGIDILVNNAGVPVAALPVAFATSDPADWVPWIDLNLYGVMYCTRAVLPSMIARGGGRIVTVISDAARVGEAGLTPYAAAKAGAAGFTRSVAREVGAHGISVNCVALGTIDHGVAAAFLDEDARKKLLKRYVIKRLGTTEDAAALISFLSSDGAEWITGQTYPVNGGFSMVV